jgi:hypothetical protein
LVRTGLDEGWVANIEIDGPKYRRSRICAPCEETKYLSITTVYMDSMEAKAFPDHDDEDEKNDSKGEVLLGQYHQHPYGKTKSPLKLNATQAQHSNLNSLLLGEINCVVQLDKSAELMGMQGWQGAGWTSPGPGTHHYPEAKGGRLVALFFLPAGRISYEAKPGMKQPLSV